MLKEAREASPWWEPWEKRVSGITHSWKSNSKKAQCLSIILCFFVMLPASLLSSICKQKIEITHLFTFSFHFMINFYVIIFQNYGSSSVSLDKLGLSELTPGPASWNVEVFVQALKEMVCNWLFQHIKGGRGFRWVDRVLNWPDLALHNHVVSASILCHPCYLLGTSRDHVTAV